MGLLDGKREGNMLLRRTLKKIRLYIALLFKAICNLIRDDAKKDIDAEIKNAKRFL